jgi:hypothetical protein
MVATAHRNAARRPLYGEETMKRGYVSAVAVCALAALAGAAFAQAPRFKLTAVKAPDLGRNMYKVHVENLTKAQYDAVEFRCDFFNGDKKVESVNGGLDNLEGEGDWVGVGPLKSSNATRSVCTLLRAKK